MLSIEAVSKLGGIFLFALSIIEAKWETASVSLRFLVPVPTCLCGWEGLILVMCVAPYLPDRNPPAVVPHQLPSPVQTQNLFYPKSPHRNQLPDLA